MLSDRRYLVVAVMLWMLANSLPAQEPRPGDVEVERYLAADARWISQSVLADATSREQWESKRAELRQQYFDMLGLWPLPEKSELHATVTGKIQRDAFSVEKLHFQSKPGLYVTGNLYLPNPFPTKKLPGVLYVCGHSGRGRDGNKTAFQHHGMWFATHGYGCLIIDTLQLGEIEGIHHGTYNRERWWWQAAGYTPAGVECWNGIRAIDYLLTRPEVDPNRIAITGISGGGAATFWIMAADERVKVCVPVSGMSDLESYVEDKVVNGHCDCMFLYNTYRWEWTTIAALVAPRPMLFENSGYDTIFPMPGNERIRLRLEQLYNWYQQKPGHWFDIGVTPGGHQDNVELRLMAYRWINKHLQEDNAEVSEPALPQIPGAELRVFPADSDLPANSINGKIDESFVALAATPLPKTKDEFNRWSKELLAGLKERVFRPWPEVVPGATVIKPTGQGTALLETESGISIEIARTSSLASTGQRDAAKAKTAKEVINDPRSVHQKNRVWLIVLNPDEAPGKVPEWTSNLIPAGQPVVVLSTRGCGERAWTRKNPPNYVERAHALLGRTVDGGRVWDIQSVARSLHEEEGGGERSMVVIGRGNSGVLGAYAALLEPCIEEVVALDPPVSHRHGPILLNVLRILDIPDAFGLLSPRPVTIVTPKAEAFERTSLAFKASSFGDRLLIRGMNE